MNSYNIRNIVRLWPFNRGKQRLANLLGFDAQKMPDGYIVTALDGRSFRIHPDGMYRRLFLEGSYDPNESDMYSCVIEKGDIVFDIGANFGWFTTLFATKVGMLGHVHAFEPNPQIYSELIYHLKLNDVQNIVHTSQLALGSEMGHTQLFTFRDLPHGFGSLSNWNRTDAQEYKVSIQTIDYYVEANQVSHCDLIKLDVEGAEMMVLQGAQSFLQSGNWPIWAIEMNPQSSKEFGYTPEDLLLFLQENAKYNIFLAYRNGSFVKISDYSDYRPSETILALQSHYHRNRLSNLIG